jgi:4-amino-4-deoxy-L-arabinose transferase-like glycosyltransferase
MSFNRDRLAVAALLLVTLLNALLSADWGAPDGATAETTTTWAVDSLGPIQPLKEALARFTREGIDYVGYPLFHYVVLAAAFAPYVIWARLTGALQNPSADFPYGAADPASFFAHLNLIASLVSALMAAGLVLAVYLSTRELFGRRAALGAMLLTALFPPLGYYGMTSNPEVPYLCWMMLAVWQLLRAARTQSVLSYGLTGVFVALSAATKDPGGGFFLALPVVLPWLAAQADGRRGLAAVARALLDRRVIAAAVAVVVTFGLANNLFFGGLDGFLRHLQFTDDIFRANIATTESTDMLARQPELAFTSVRLLLEMVGYATWALVAMGAWLAVRRRIPRTWLLPLLALTYYVFVIAPTMALSRHLFGVLLLALPFAGLAIATAWESDSARVRRGAAAIAIVSVVLQAVACAHLHYTLRNDSRYALAAWIEENVPPGTAIESQTQARYLPRLHGRQSYSIVGNSFDAVNYALRGAELTAETLARRAPEYVLVLADSSVSGDPARARDRDVQEYFTNLLEGRAGYEVVARFETPTYLPYRQITAGTQPTSILLERRSESAAIR